MTPALGAVTFLLIGLMVGPTWGQTAPSIGELLQMLHSGGYVIVVRHGATNPDQVDTDPFNPDNISKQRQLSDKGRADAKLLGDVFKAAGVPIGQSYSSQFYRALETARLIGGKAPTATPDVTEGGLVVSPNENNRRARAFRAIVATSPDPGTNTLVVTHKPNILDASVRTGSKSRKGRRRSSSPMDVATTR